MEILKHVMPCKWYTVERECGHLEGIYIEPPLDDMIIDSAKMVTCSSCREKPPLWEQYGFNQPPRRLLAEIRKSQRREEYIEEAKQKRREASRRSYLKKKAKSEGLTEEQLQRRRERDRERKRKNREAINARRREQYKKSQNRSF